MTEIVEYTLAVMASTLFVAGSVLVYGNYASFESGLSLRATFDAVSGLALRALQNGTAAATMSIPSSTIGCQGGVLEVRVGPNSQEERFPLGCQFDVSVPGGVHTLRFRVDDSQLYLAVV